MRKWRVAIVVQRYGEEINGGAELAARWLAERLCDLAKVHVVTTCAVDFTTWENHYPPGESLLNGVHVLRFPVDQPRNWKQSQRETGHLLLQGHSLFDELDWIKSQGPYSTSLFNYIETSYAGYDVFIFFTFLYATTFFGLPLVSDKAILVPTAHDDPYLALPIMRALFHLPRALIYLTEPEKEAVHRVTRNKGRPHLVAGIGIEVPEQVSARRFRHKYDIEGDFVLYSGRVHESKNVPELLRHFIRFCSNYPKTVRLILTGTSHIDIPEHPDVVHLGFLPDEDKFDAIHAATVALMPSLHESLSIFILEAWFLGVPVLVNGRCEVLKHQCRRSNAGLYYSSYDEFEFAMTLLLDSPKLRAQLGSNGSIFVKENYSWDSVVSKYLSLFDSVASRQG